MPQLSIDASSLVITPVAEATPAYIYRKTASGDFEQTNELKKDEQGVQIWNIPARVIIPGVPAPIATKVTMASPTQPTGYPIETPVSVQGLSLAVFGNLSFSITSLGENQPAPLKAFAKTEEK